MQKVEFRAPIGEMLRLAECGELPDGWLHLPAGPIDISSPSLFLASAADKSDPEAYAAEQGFPREGLDAATLTDIAQWTKHQLAAEPTDEQLLRSFEYYWRFDAFLPSLEAADPPPRRTVLEELDRTFFESLGVERQNTECRHPDCSRGTVQFSVFCRRHHFESVKGRAWQGRD